LIDHFYSAHIHSFKCSWRLADVLACSQKVSHSEMRLVSAASFHFPIFLYLYNKERPVAMEAIICKIKSPWPWNDGVFHCERQQYVSNLLWLTVCCVTWITHSSFGA
jgi:hypothetical protein